MAELHSYQHRAAEFVRSNPKAALWLDVGLGKSAITLDAIRQLLAEGEIFSVLVIAPKRVAEHTWPQERDTWTPDLPIRVIAGTAAERRRAVLDPAPVHVIGIDNVIWLVEHFGARWPYDAVVIDESQKFKDPSSQRFKAMRKICKHFDRVILLSATPASESLLGLWSQVFLTDRGERLGRSFTAYKNAFWQADYMGWNLTPAPDAEKRIQARLEGLVLSMRADDYLDMPDRIDNTITVDLPDMDAYRRMEREYLLPIKSGEVVTAANAAVLAGKLLQLSSGAIYDEDKVVHVLHSAKIDALKELIDAANGQPVLCFYSFRHEVDRIKHAIKGAEDLNIDKWNAGKQRLALAHPASAGAGLNLQHGGCVIVWFSIPWSLELYMQANGRLHRQGQKRTVVINHLVASETIDEDVMAALQDKSAGQDRLLNALKRRIT